jgi:Luciferase-like monooxygenase
MSGVRVIAHFDSTHPPALVTAANQAEAAALDGVWVGSFASEPSRKRDAATTATLAAIAASTEVLRMGAVIGPLDDASTIATAEELAVIDQASNGRLEVVLRATASLSFEDQASALERAWQGTLLPDGRVVAVTPRPRQPALPMMAFGSADGRASEWWSQCLPYTSALERPRMVGTRTGVIVGLTQDEPRLEDDLERFVREVQRTLASCDGTELVISMDPMATDLTWRLHAVASVVIPALRANAYEFDLILDDALRWFQQSPLGAARVN